MKTLVILEINHSKPMPQLANLIAGRAWSIQGVTRAEVVTSPSMSPAQLQEAGFTLAEISLGSAEVVRS